MIPPAGFGTNVFYNPSDSIYDNINPKFGFTSKNTLPAYIREAAGLIGLPSDNLIDLQSVISQMIRHYIMKMELS